MPCRSNISLLPPSFRKQLDARLRASAFGDLVNISAWLTRRGHPVGKSAIGVYAMKCKRQLEGASAATAPMAVNAAAIRLGCLHVAAQTGPAAGLLRRATAYANWVLQLDQGKASK